MNHSLVPHCSVDSELTIGVCPLLDSSSVKIIIITYYVMSRQVSIMYIYTKPYTHISRSPSDSFCLPPPSPIFCTLVAVVVLVFNASTGCMTISESITKVRWSYANFKTIWKCICHARLSCSMWRNTKHEETLSMKYHMYMLLHSNQLKLTFWFLVTTTSHIIRWGTSLHSMNFWMRDWRYVTQSLNNVTCKPV